MKKFFVIALLSLGSMSCTQTPSRVEGRLMSIDTTYAGMQAFTPHYHVSLQIIDGDRLSTFTAEISEEACLELSQLEPLANGFYSIELTYNTETQVYDILHIKIRREKSLTYT